MERKYILNLYRQYCNSIKKECKESNLYEDKEFINWVSLLNLRTRQYKNYLDFIGLELESASSLELGKGKYDTLGNEFVTIVSPFAKTLNLSKSNLVIYKNEPLIISNSNIYSSEKFKLFLAQNTFFKEEVNNLIKLHNIGLDVCLGMYGSIFDEDIKTKISLLESSVRLMNDDYNIFYDIDKDNYFTCVKSSKKIKRRIKTIV